MGNKLIVLENKFIIDHSKSAVLDKSNTPAEGGFD